MRHARPHTARLGLLFAALALALWGRPAGAAPVPVASFEDPEGDADGPGGWRPPTDAAYQPGDFDLRRFAVLTEGDEVLFVVTLGAAVRPPPPGLQDGLGAMLPPGGLSLQTIDIYIDEDRTPGAGVAACLPGRRVAFADGRTWEAAVVLTPQPEEARALARKVLGPAAERVVFPVALTLRGRTITARVPAAALGGSPRPAWGYSVQVSGARLRAPGTATSPEDLTLPVLQAAGPYAFGGAPPGQAHPQVVDVLLPPGVEQARVLGGFDATTGALARVPFVYGVAQGAEPAAVAPAAAATPTLDPALAAPPVALSPNLMPRLSSAPPPAAAPSSAGASGPAALVVTAMQGELVSAKGSVAGLAPMQFGRVVDGQGMTVARVMILRLLDQSLVASAIAGADQIKPGQRLVFDAAPPARPAGP